MRVSWGSVRTKIFFGCISLTLVTIMVAVLSQRSQSELGDTALGIYDNTFIPMSDLRSAQAITLSVSRDLAEGKKTGAVFIDELQSALDALDVAEERAMSPRGEDYAKRLHAAVSDLQARLTDRAEPPDRLQFKSVEKLFDMAVQIYAADGFRMRGSVEARVLRTRWETDAAMLASIVTAIIISFALSRAIVPSIRNAARIATAIASGRLDNTIDKRASGEPGALLDALAIMQASIAEKIACIERLMAQQASSYAAEIALQNTRFEAALDNMTLGLCMFDDRNTLLVQNRQFGAMFLDAEGAGAAAVVAQLHTRPPDPSKDSITSSRSFNRLLDDGRTIAVCEKAMGGGGRVVTYEDITERQRAEARLSHMARHDALTGLPNRILFREHVEHAIQEARRGGTLAVLCLDLDRFKAVNDTLGHPLGDALLQEAAVRLLQITAETDLVARLGGDEFAVVSYAPGRGHDVRPLAERLISALALPFDIQGHKISIGTSIGIAATEDWQETPDELLKNADLALYLAKADGRGCYRFFEREMDAQIQAKRRLELDLRSAIGDHQLEVLYQPLFSVRGSAIVAFEALLRWHHPERGVVSPAEFIPLAEETGLISDLGLWVLNRACEDAMDWPSGVKVAVNLSPLQFRNRTLVSDVTQALQRSGLPASRLELEITESLMLQDTAATLAMLHDLRARGISISMDDFGTGYSSLNYLRCFPFDKIKIDRSFIASMDEGSDSLAIVTAIISLGQSLRMNVVAEGVETNEQLALLRQAGCHQIQGYLLGRPQSASAAAMLSRRVPIDAAA